MDDKIKKPEGRADKKKWRALRRSQLNLPAYSLSEEIASAATHGIGAGLAVAAFVLLLVFSRQDAAHILCNLLYGITLFLLYIVSTIYHALGINRGKKVFRVLDHCSIFLLIAGTYTPISILIIGGWVGWTLFSVIWGMAVLGIVFNAIDVKKYSKLSMVCYLVMGWSVILAVKPLAESMPSQEIVLLIAGGVAYTIGAVFYVVGKKKKYIHSIWHLFVLAGSVLHYFSIFNCVTG